MDREHWVPLSAAIVKLLNTLPGMEDSGDKAEFALRTKLQMPWSLPIGVETWWRSGADDGCLGYVSCRCGHALGRSP
jgi:hypothetical protein